MCGKFHRHEMCVPRKAARDQHAGQNEMEKCVRDPHNHDHLLSRVNYNDMLHKQTSSHTK